MALLTESWLYDSLSVLTALIVVLISWVKYSHGYWKRRGVPTPPVSFPLGHSKSLFAQTESFADFTLRKYQYFKDVKTKHGGFYMIVTPSYMPLDLDVIKSILQNDFSNFTDRGQYYDEENDPLSAHLFSLDGTKWRNLRVKLSPTFTSGKMKMMFETLAVCGKQLKAEMDKKTGECIDIKDMLVRFTTDIIGNCAFGLDCNSLQNPNNEFVQTFRTFFVNNFKENIIGFISFLAPSVARLLKLKIVKPDITNFFMRVVKDTVNYREENNVYRKDFMHLLLQLKNRGELSDDKSILKEDNTEQKVTLSMNELAAQAFVFFLAGFETSSTTMTFCLFELASNPDIQEKIREEVNEVLKKHDNKLTYDAMMEMHYMEQAINETLRKYPPLPVLTRLCNKDYKIPGSNLVLEKGLTAMIPVIGIHHDPEIYPEPEKFDPERFSEENKRERHPFSFLPFGEGPRICIGLRFGMMQTKVGLSVLLQNYRFSINSKTELPLKLDPRSFIMTAEKKIWLDYQKLE